MIRLGSRPLLPVVASLALCALAVVPLRLANAADPRSSAAPPEPGSLARFVSYGQALDELGEILPPDYSSEPDGTDPSALFRGRPYTEADAAAGRYHPDFKSVAVSPDGLQIVTFVQDPDGFVIPGGTPDDDLGTPNRRTGTVLALFDISGTLVRVLDVEREEDLPSGHTFLEYRPGEPITWLDQSHVVVSAHERILAGTEAETFRGVLRNIDVTDAEVEAEISIEDGTLRGGHIDRGWAGGGTVVAASPDGTAYVFADGTRTELPDTGVNDPAFTGYEQAAVSPDGDHIAVTYRGELGVDGSPQLVDVFDHVDGTWVRRALDVPDLTTSWPRWLPYQDYADAELLVATQTQGDPQATATAVRVEPGLSPAARVSRTFPALEGAHAWQPVPVPPDASNAADVAVTLEAPAATAGTPWTGLVRVTGRGPGAVHDLELAVELDDLAITLTLEPGAGGTCDLGTCAWSALASGESATVSISATFPATGVVPLTVRATTNTLDWNPGNDLRRGAVRVQTPAGSASTGRLVHQEAGGDIVTTDPDGTGRTLVRAGSPATLALLDVHPATRRVLWGDHSTLPATYGIRTLGGDQVDTFTLPTEAVPQTEAISPDGRTFYYVVFDDGGSVGEVADDHYRLMELRLDKPGAQPRLRRDWTGGFGKHLRVSPDGTRLSYMWQPIGAYIDSAVVESLDFFGPGRGISLAAHGEGHANSAPAWSPDSQRVAFALGVDSPFDENVVVVAYDAADPGEADELGTLGSSLWLGQWAPDGGRLLLGDLDSAWTLDLGTGEATKILDRPAWWTGEPAAGQPTPTDPTTSTSATASPSASTSTSATASPSPSTSTSTTPSSPTPSTTTSAPVVNPPAGDPGCAAATQALTEATAKLQSAKKKVKKAKSPGAAKKARKKVVKLKKKVRAAKSALRGC